MSELARTEGSWLGAMIHGEGHDVALPKPFEREIFLFDTHVAGTGYVDDILDLEPGLEIDDKLEFFREPDNPYDHQAIVIRNSEGAKLGYVPRADNVVFARLMDAGKLIFGRISRKSLHDEWLTIEIRIYLLD